MFFDHHARFLETSTTAASKARLNLRHAAIIGEHRSLLDGRRVLDIASHDGRWSLAALKTAHAAHVTGVEARPELVDHAEQTFAHYGADPQRYRFVNADVFDVLADPATHRVGRSQVDVVLCLGFLYHTLRFSELLGGIRRLRPEAMLLDTAVYPGEGKMVRLFGEDTSKQSASVDGEHGHDGRMLTGRPTVEALRLMLEVHGYTVERTFDWNDFLDRHDFPDRPARQYREGRRVTWVCRPA